MKISKPAACFFLLFVIAIAALVGLIIYLVRYDVLCPGEYLKHEDTSPVATTPEVPHTTSPAPTGPEPYYQVRLPTNIVPVHYDVSLRPNVTLGTFTGSIDVLLHMVGTEPTTWILINTNLLDVTGHTLWLEQSGGAREVVPISEGYHYQPNEYYVIVTGQDLTQGSNYTLQLIFNGSLTTNIVGFYRSSFVNRLTSASEYVVSSKFQPTFARQAFPCFDEPNIKSTFTVTLYHDPQHTALSNMPVQASTRESDGLQKTIYEKSVDMSVYLVCFVIGNYAYKETLMQSGKQFRVYATPDVINQAQYAVDVGVQMSNYFENYFGISYALPKQDMIAIPDFVSGAMEHWGLITFREVNLLYDPIGSSASNQQRVATVISHELAHMWFGNLVTMNWWDDLWLNEGFASFIEYKGVNIVEPTWSMLDQFIVQDLQPVMVTDSKSSSHPIIVPVNHPDQITEIFDAISYNKGSSIIRMLEAYVTEEVFRQGISRYLNIHKFSTAVTDDLWIALEQVSGRPIKHMMDTWTLQMGYPVVKVTRDLLNPTRATLTQTRFLLDPDDVPEKEEYTSPFGYKWYISLSYITQSGQTGNIIIDRNETSKSIVWPGSGDQWVKFNRNQVGFFRVNYERNMWQKLVSALVSNHNGFQAADRSNLIDDAFNLARAGELPYEVALSLSTYLNQERDYIPWDTAYSQLTSISSLLEGTDAYPLLRRYINSRCSPLLQNVLGWNDDGSHTNKLLRSDIIHLACGNGDENCLFQAKQKFEEWTRGTSIPANLKTSVYRYGMEATGDLRSWDFMWNKYLNESVSQERSRLLYGLAQTREIWLLNRYIQYAEDESKVKRQDYFSVLIYITINPVGQHLVWRYVRENWQKMVDRFGLNERYLGRMVPRVISSFNTKYQLEEVETFFEKYPNAGAGARARKQALVSIRSNIDWLAKHQQDVHTWLVNNVNK